MVDQADYQRLASFRHVIYLRRFSEKRFGMHTMGRCSLILQLACTYRKGEELRVGGIEKCLTTTYNLLPVVVCQRQTEFWGGIWLHRQRLEKELIIRSQSSTPEPRENKMYSCLNWEIPQQKIKSDFSWLLTAAAKPKRTFPNFRVSKSVV